MKAYLITTGVVFGGVTVAHVAKVWAEWPGPAKDPFFILLTLVAVCLCAWAFRLLASSPRH